MDTLEFMLNLIVEIENENLLSTIFGLTLKNELICKNEDCNHVRGQSHEQFSISISFNEISKILIYDLKTKRIFEVYLGAFFIYSFLEIFQKISNNFYQVKCQHDNDILFNNNDRNNNNNNNYFEKIKEDFNSKLIDKYNETANLNKRLMLILLINDEKMKNDEIINEATATTPLNFPVSLYDALLTHGKAEMMDLPCKCKKNKIQQRLAFEQINNFLIIKINRKTNNDSILEVPLKNLEMKYFFTKEKSRFSAHFNLFATIDHYGSSRGGHYLAKVFDEKSSKWYVFNDSSCHEEKEENLKMNRNSIILIYKK